MDSARLLAIAEEVLSLPTAPYHEQQVRAAVLAHCTTLNLRAKRDPAGNVIAQYQPAGAPPAPLVFVAHMDHPGFEALSARQAEFLGDIPPEMLAPGTPLRFQTGKGVVRTRIRSRAKSAKLVANLQPTPGLARGSFGQWDFPAFRVRGDKLAAVGIDDVLSVAVLIAGLTELVRAKVRTHVWAVFTRAEEVGFHGAIAVARSGLVPRDALVISLEMSSRRPWAKLGNGPVIRIGDRTSTYDPHGTLFLQAAAKRAGITAQRALMDGGTCEATAFAAYGYRVGGLCLPLGNYHNIGPKKRPAPEFVSVRDLTGLGKLLNAAATDWPQFGRVGAEFRRRIEKVKQRWPRKLADA